MFRGNVGFFLLYFFFSSEIAPHNINWFYFLIFIFTVCEWLNKICVYRQRWSVDGPMFEIHSKRKSIPIDFVTILIFTLILRKPSSLVYVFFLSSLVIRLFILFYFFFQLSYIFSFWNFFSPTWLLPINRIAVSRTAYIGKSSEMESNEKKV